MGVFSTDHPWVFIAGLVGNISSFVVFLAPLPTFIRICKKKSTEGFHSLPYVVSLFSAMLWIYYAMVKTGAFLLITINSFGCVVETIYIAIYIAYATKQSRISTLRMLLLLDVGVFCVVLLVIQYLTKGPNRVEFLGWFCVVFATSVFVAPLSIMRQVIITKSVEFMPFNLSLMLTFSAVAWLFYGIFLKDLHVAIPNVLGLVFGILQMVLYAVYKNKKPTKVIKEVKVPQHKIDVRKLGAVIAESEVVEISSSEPVIHDDDHHEMIGNSCKLHKTEVVEEVKVPQHTIDVTKLSAVMEESEVEEIPSSEPVIPNDDHHEMIGNSCKSQDQFHDDHGDQKILELPNSNKMLGECEA